jgi:RNase P/RNase MRP subunit p29
VDETKIPYIGKTLVVSKSSQPTIVGMQGTIVDETAQTFIVDVNGEQKTILKKGTEFVIDTHKIIGDDITKRPEERIKQKRRKKTQ